MAAQTVDSIVLFFVRFYRFYKEKKEESFLVFSFVARLFTVVYILLFRFSVFKPAFWHSF